MNEVQNLLSEAANFDSFEAFENYVAAVRPDLYNKVMSSAGSMKRSSLAPNVIATRGAKALPSNKNVMIAGGKNTPSAAATFTIQVIRETNLIAGTLPVGLFGYLGQNNTYADFINQYLPTGVTVSLQFNQDGSIYFEFFDGTNTDYVLVKCNEIAYRAFINATGISNIQVNKVRYDISDTSKTQQFSQTFNIASKDLMGKFKQETLTPSTFKSPEQFQSGIVDLDIHAAIRPETCFVLGVANTGVANFTVTLTNFVSILDKVV